MSGKYLKKLFNAITGTQAANESPRFTDDFGKKSEF